MSRERRRTVKCGSLMYKCEKCNHEVELQLTAKTTVTEAKVKKESAPAPAGVPIYTIPTFPLYVEFKHRGFWITNSEGIHEPTLDEQCNRNSVMLANDCLLYVYKLALRLFVYASIDKELLSMKVITPYDIDPANLVPHVMVRKNPIDPFSKYKNIQGERFIITEAMISVKSDFMIVELDEKRDLHMTLIYSKKIKIRVNLIEAFKHVLQILNSYPQLIQEYASLPYFGQNATEYWYENPNSFPSQINVPAGYVPKPKLIRIPSNVSAAGTILS